MSTLKNRLLIFIDKEGLNPNQFYVKTGLANGFLDKVGNKMNRSTVEKIEKAFPHLNIDYLVYGKGEMIKPLSQVSSSILVGNGNKNIQLGHGSKTMHVNESNSDLKNKIIELEVELVRLIGQLAVKDETIKGLRNELALKTEMITFLQNHNKKN